jgi:hypothetical protein
VVATAERIVRFLLVMERKNKAAWSHRIAWVNGEPAVVTLVGERVVFTTSVETDGDRIMAAYRVLNPDKLHHVAGVVGAASAGG